MIFRTELSIPASQNLIDHTQSLLTIGSCFSQHIGHRLQKYKFKCISNPFGTVFNPISIAKLLHRAKEKKYATEDELMLSHGVWVHPDFHSSLCDSDKHHTLSNINNSIKTVHEVLLEIKFLFVTLGTSVGYRLLKNNAIVANCHKLPASDFEKINISVEEGYKALKDIMNQFYKINPELHIVLTISPVRHIKDGIIENSFNKGRLHAIVEKLLGDGGNISYFPAYEWLMDDLRDYRFYDEDLIHPNEVAIEYIWQKFGKHFFDYNTAELCKKVDHIIKASQHRPFNPLTEEHIKFKNNQLESIQLLTQEHPYLDFTEEKNIIEKGL